MLMLSKLRLLWFSETFDRVNILINQQLIKSARMNLMLDFCPGS